MAAISLMYNNLYVLGGGGVHLRRDYSGGTIDKQAHIYVSVALADAAGWYIPHGEEVILCRSSRGVDPTGLRTTYWVCTAARRLFPALLSQGARSDPAREMNARQELVVVFPEQVRGS